jgi:hypothetical protein
MKYLLSAFLLATLVNGCIANAETLKQEQIAIKSLIKKMYAVSFNEFEAATFGAKYKNCEEIVKGKYEPDRQCLLLTEFLVKEAVIKEKGVNQGCMSGFRYPGLDTMDLSPLECTDPPPTPSINTPIVNGNKATVRVALKENGSHVIYYLRKQPKGWRIYRAESSVNDATLETQGQGDMVYVFPPEE